MKFEIDKDFVNANISRTIRFSETIFQDLIEISEKEKISFNLLVLQCCRFAINNFKNSEPPEDQKSKKPKKTKTDN